MMNKALKIVLIVVGGIVVLFFVGRLSGALTYYKVPSRANYPTYKMDENVVVSNTDKPQRFDHIFYRTPRENGAFMDMSRLCGLEDDLIEIKKGILYVNGKSTQGRFDVAHRYFIAGSLVKEVMTELDSNYTGLSSTDFYLGSIILPDSYAEKKGADVIIILYKKGEPNSYYLSAFSEDWNEDNFGPVRVPKGKYFVVGDNRHLSYDSRHFGFIQKDDYIGTVIE